MINDGLWSVVTLIVTGLSSGIAASWAIGRLFIEKWLDHELSRFQKVLDARLAVNATAAQTLAGVELSVYPALAELVYKGKAGATKASTATNQFEVANAELVDACCELTARLYSYRVYLPPETFQSLHKYKHLLQDLLMYADLFTRPDVAKDIAMTSAHRDFVRIRHEEIASSCDAIIADLRRLLVALKGEIADIHVVKGALS